MGRLEAEIENLRKKLSDNESKDEVVGVSRRNMADALFKAVYNCRFNKVKFLLNNGVPKNTKNDNDQNLLVCSLYISSDDKRAKMFRFLLRRGVDYCGMDHRTGRDVLSWACYLGRAEQVEETLEVGGGEIDLLRKDFEGMTPLHQATRAGHIDVVRLLVKVMSRYRLSVDTADVHGLTPYIYARRLGYHAIANVLLTEGRASKRQFDSVMYKSADDWAIIGERERRERHQLYKEKEAALYKIRGRLPPLEENAPSSFSLPTVKLTTSLNKEEVLTQNEDSLPDDPLQNKPRRISKLEPLRDSSNQSEDALPLTTKSVDAAISLIQMQAGYNSNRRTSFVSSVFDTSKADQYSDLYKPDINSMLDMVSNQQCPAFRITAKPPTPSHLNFSKYRTKISSLAIVLGKGDKKSAKGSSAVRRKTVAHLMGGPIKAESENSTPQLQDPNFLTVDNI